MPLSFRRLGYLGVSLLLACGVAMSLAPPCPGAGARKSVSCSCRCCGLEKEGGGVSMRGCGCGSATTPAVTALIAKTAVLPCVLRLPSESMDEPIAALVPRAVLAENPAPPTPPPRIQV